MANDLITRLLLETGAFDNNLKKSTKQVQDFQNKMKSVGNTFNSSFGTLTKFVPQLAALTGGIALATEAFNKAVGVNQAFGDGLDIIKTKIDATSTAFMSAAINGGLNSFFNRLEDIQKKAEDVAKAMDDLASSKSFSKMQSDYWKAKAMESYNNGDLQGAKDYLKKATISAEDFQNALSDAAVKNVNSVIAQQLAGVTTDVKIPDITEDEFLKIMGMPRQKLDKLAEYIKPYFDKVKETEWYVNGFTPWGSNQKVYGSDDQKQIYYNALDDLNNYLESNKTALIAYIRWLSNDGENALNDALSKYVEAQNILTEFSKLDKKFNANTTTSKSPNERIGIDSSITSPTATLPNNLESGWLKAKASIEDYGQSLRGAMLLQKLYAEETANSAVQTKNLNNDMYALNTMTSLFSNSINNIEGADAFSKLTQSIIPLIGAIMALTVAEGEEKAAKTSSNVFQLIASIAAVTTAIVGTFQANKNAGKYANGGIIGGSSSVGDNLVAHVNAGEMILNGSQQANLFRMLNDGSIKSNNDGIGQVEFKLRGQELIGLINNTNRKNSKLI